MNRQGGGRVVVLALAAALLGRPGAFAGSLGGSEPDAAAIQSYRARLNEILALNYHVATVLQQTRSQTALADGMARVQALTDEDVGRLMSGGVDLSRLHRAVQELDRVVSAQTPGGPGSTESAAPASVGFPDAQYSVLCGSVRPDTNVVFAVQVTFQAAAVVWAVANRVCEQVVVAGGTGGNTSLACVALDVTLQALQFILADLVFCAGDIDSAEIKGTYDRVGHLHGDVTALDGKVDASRDAILANENGNASAIMANDNANRGAIVANDDANRDVIVANDNANRDLILAKLEDDGGDKDTRGQFDALKKRQIEDNLAGGQCPAWMYTPKFLDASKKVRLGGHLEQVLDVLEDVIENAAKLHSVGKHELEEARRALEAAVAKAARRPLDADRLCALLLEAYEEATARTKEGHEDDHRKE